MEKLAIKKSGICVYGWLLIAVFAFSVFLLVQVKNVRAYDCANPGEVVNLNTGMCEDSAGQETGPAIPSSTDTELQYSCPTNQIYDLNSHSCVLISLANKQAASAANAGKKDVVECTGSNSFGIPKWLGSPVTCGFYFLGSTILWFFSKLVYLAGILFDTAIQISIYSIKDYINNPQINLVWSTVRDLGNIVFIFFLLWISIQTILGIDNAKKYLANIVITALLVNFSLFFSKVIIDTSNIVALQFYSQIVDQKCITGGGGFDGCVSDKLMAATKLSTIYNAGKGNNTIELSVTNITIVTILGSIFFLITAFVLMQAAFMFIARTVAFVILAAISPIAFIAAILPQTAKYSKEWWKNMTDQALVAPIFLLFIWLVIQLSSLGGGGSLFTASNTGSVDTGSYSTALVNGDSGSMKLVFGFFFLIGLIYMALKITKEYSGKIGAAGVEWGMKSLGLGAGLSGGLLRNTLGAGANYLARQKWLQDRAATSTGWRALHKTAIGAAEASYDMKAGIPLVGGVAGKVLKEAGISTDFGKAAGKGGYRAKEKAAAEADTKYAKDELKEAGIETQKAFVENIKGMNMLQRFITGRTTGSPEKTAKAMNKIIEEEEQDKANKSRVKDLNERLLAGDESLQSMTGMSAEQLRMALNSTNEEMVKRFEEVQDKLQEKIGDKMAELVGAQTAAAAGDVSQGEKAKNISSEINKLNLTMRHMDERQKLKDKIEVRANRQAGQGGGEAKKEEGDKEQK